MIRATARVAIHVNEIRSGRINSIGQIYCSTREIWSGRKLTGIEQLPEHFIKRAEPEHSELLAVDLSIFDKPLPDPLRSRYSGA